MKTIHILPLHSVVDIITNSSSELFICNSLQTVEEIEQFFASLGELVCGGGNCGIGKVKIYHGVSGLKELMEDHYHGYFDGDTLRKIISRFIDYEDDFDVPDFNHSHYHTYDEHSYNDDAYDFMVQLGKTNINNWLDEHADYLNKVCQDVVTIESAGDNTIPYHLFDLIDNHFNGMHIHLG